jgi:hypothetical protein
MNLRIAFCVALFCCVAGIKAAAVPCYEIGVRHGRGWECRQAGCEWYDDGHTAVCMHRGMVDRFLAKITCLAISDNDLCAYKGCVWDRGGEKCLSKSFSSCTEAKTIEACMDLGCDWLGEPSECISKKRDTPLFSKNSFPSSCTACTEEKGELKCICKKNLGRLLQKYTISSFQRETKLNITNCKEGTIENYNGHLKCYVDAPLFNKNAFSSSCTGCVEENDKLSCKCNDGYDYQEETQLDIKYCKEGTIENVSGHLKCEVDTNKIPGSFKKSCLRCELKADNKWHETQLECSCDKNNWLGRSSISLSDCRKEIVNLNERLNCR